MDLRTFLAHAVQLELEAEVTYLHLIDLTKARGDGDASAFFGEMAGFSRMHRQAAMERAGFASLDEIPAVIAEWDGGGEAPRLAGAAAPLDLDGATLLALAAERRGVAFYEEVSRTAGDGEARSLALEFCAEEQGHVLALERFLGLKPY